MYKQQIFSHLPTYSRRLGPIEVGSVGTLYLHVTYIHLRSGHIYKINIENIEITRKRKKERSIIKRGSREVLPNIGPIPIIIPLKLFLEGIDFLTDNVSWRRSKNMLGLACECEMSVFSQRISQLYT